MQLKLLEKSEECYTRTSWVIKSKTNRTVVADAGKPWFGRHDLASCDDIRNTTISPVVNGARAGTKVSCFCTACHLESDKICHMVPNVSFGGN